MNISPESNISDDHTIIPEPTQRARDIFQAECSLKQKVSLRKTISREEDEIRRFILTRTPIIGKIPSVDEIWEVYNQFPKDEIDKILERLDQMDYIHVDSEKTTIDAAYPFSGTETSHIVTIKREEYKKIHAMCAVDALGICFMFDSDVLIESKCHHCHDKVDIKIMNNKIISLQPKDVVVWFDMDYSCCAAISCCPNTNFFSSEQHFIKWHETNLQRKGAILNIQETFYLGKLFFEDRIKKMVIE
jgi:hypothetical protein